MEQISRHFMLQEFLVSEYAARNNIDMTPPMEVRTALRALATSVLDPLREALAMPVIISSGYRPKELNRAIGGASDSQHCVGEAADIHVPGMTPLTLAKVIKQLDLPYDQLIMEFGEWVHVSHKPLSPQRKEILTAKKIGKHTQYLPGFQ